MINDKPIGFFDSGVGGLSVLRETIKLMPYENFIYFGDSKNAPYGIKSVEEVKKLTFNAVDFLMKKNVKAVVIACNTATSAAIEDLRETYKTFPIIGIEPALKPAVELGTKGKILIMATPMTLSESKFAKLMDHYKAEADIEPLPCPGLVELIEEGILHGDLVKKYLLDKLSPYMNSDIAAVVLGCTHYPFVREEISSILRENGNIPVIDGSEGTARQLKKQLELNNLLNNCSRKGKVEIFNSLENDAVIELSRKLLFT